MNFKKIDFIRNLDFDNNYYKLDFSSNDYLCLSRNKDALDYAYNFCQNFNSGGGGSRLIIENNYFREFEDFFAKLKNKESCLTFSSGWQANVSILNCIINNLEDDVNVFIDRLCHNSLYFGLNSLFRKDVKKFRYKNNDLNNLEGFLKNSKSKNKIVITETVFSMDGNVLDLKELIYLKKKYNFFLVLDDAHSFGLFGNNLKGITENFEEEIDIITGTFSKAVGCQGGYVLSSNFIRNLIINKAYGLIYSTAVSPFLIGFAFYVIKNLIPNLKDEVKNLLELSDYLRNQIEVKGIYKTKGTSQIIPILQDFDFLEKKNKQLKDEQIKLPLIKSPTVLKNEERFRISLNILHTKKDVDYLLNILH